MILRSILLCTLMIASPAFAQQQHMGHSAPAAQSIHPSTQEFNDANAKMHAGMAIVFSGKPDVDFVKGMIAHHQGAIDMAKIELKYGTDPAIRKLAEGIIKAQTSEIAMMKNWLKGKE
jgi:uncharacterized protein (DUF305 family)